MAKKILVAMLLPADAPPTSPSVTGRHNSRRELGLR
jgi:hypothetical protein